MLDKINLSQTIDKKAYKNILKELDLKLTILQQEIQRYKIPVILAFEGWSASGKGTIIGRLVYPLDPRYFNVYTMNRLSEESVMRPFMWSYWINTPEKGRMTIFDKSWHRAILPEGVEKWKLTSKEQKNLFYDVNAFEKQLSDDGCVIIKLFLHMSKEEQEIRMKELEKNPDTKWRIDKDNWQQNKNYDQYVKLFENMIHSTNLAESPWHIIEANDTKFAIIKVMNILVNRLEFEIEKRKEKELTLKEKTTPQAQREFSILSTVDVKKTITDEEYKKQLSFYQAKMNNLGYKMYDKRRSVVIVYEGWDAAGKGGNIRRLTQEMDPRGYEVVSVAAPSAVELSHHYLWRFYNKLPKDGHMAIFDRSWYGRVMVERIEGFCSEEEWRRAYKEINDMERHLYHNDTIVMKFWLHIDQEEQLSRFQMRQNNPLKQYKITDEDWRNREKWDEYEKAVDEMLFRTNTDYAPWYIIESNCKKFARIKVLKYVTEELEKRLN